MKGRIVNTSSGAVDHFFAGRRAYCTTKGALNQFTRSLALEEPGITAIDVDPETVDPPPGTYRQCNSF